MYRHLIAIALLADLTMQAEAQTPAADWPGVYKVPSPLGEDIIEIVRIDDAHAYVRLEIQFHGGHDCSFHEIMQVEAGKLTYQGKASTQDATCDLAVEQQGTGKDAKLAVVDKDDRCRIDYCGARGIFNTNAWPLSAKRAIRYMERLKASTEYRDALTHAGPASAN